MKKPADYVLVKGLGVAQGLHPHQGAGRHLWVSMNEHWQWVNGSKGECRRNACQTTAFGREESVG